MNIPEFIGQAQEEFKTCEEVLDYFDHTVAAYKTIEGIDNISVYGNIDNSYSSLILQIKSPELSNLNAIHNRILNNIGCRKDLYGQSFTIKSRIDDNSVEMLIQANR